MGKNNIAAANQEFSDTVANFSRARNEIILAIDQLTFDENKLKKRPISVDEQIEISNKRVDQAAQRYENVIGNPYNATDLIAPALHDNVMTHFDSIDGYTC